MTDEPTQEQPQGEGAQDQDITLTGSYDEVPKMDEPPQASMGETGQASNSVSPQTQSVTALPWNPDVARAIVQSASNLPAVFYGSHLIMTPPEVECAVMPLYEVGRKYGLDQFQYMAELSLVLALAAIGGVMRQKHEAYKKATGQTEDKPQAVREAPQEKRQEVGDKFDEAVSRI